MIPALIGFVFSFENNNKIMAFVLLIYRHRSKYLGDMGSLVLKIFPGRSDNEDQKDAQGTMLGTCTLPLQALAQVQRLWHVSIYFVQYLLCQV